MKKILVIVVLMIGFLMILEGLGYFLKVERVLVNGEELERSSIYGVDMELIWMGNKMGVKKSSIKYEEDFGYCGIDDRFFDDIVGLGYFKADVYEFRY